jgi:hypothetical protein
VRWHDRNGQKHWNRADSKTVFPYKTAKNSKWPLPHLAKTVQSFPIAQGTQAANTAQSRVERVLFVHAPLVRRQSLIPSLQLLVPEQNER